MKIGDKVKIRVNSASFDNQVGMITGKSGEFILVKIDGHRYEYEFSPNELELMQ